MRNCGITGLVADIIGKGPEAPHKRCVALRADMDALSMTEDNSTLPYCS